MLLGAHALVAAAAIAVTLVAALWGGAASFRRRPAGRLLQHLIALAQTLLVAQVGLGLLLLSDERRAPDQLHYVYGTLALAVVLSPWVYAPAEPRRRLAWFAGATLVAALLSIRAYTTS